MKPSIIRKTTSLITAEEWDRAKRELAGTPVDPDVGIRIVTVKIENGIGTYVTEISPGKAASIHYHPEGSEEYEVLSGQGRIRLLALNEREAGKTVPDETPVGKGDAFVIPAGCMHQLVSADKSLVFIFKGEANHLTSENRVLTPDFVPPPSPPPAQNL